ncbi:MAG: fibronectin type III domain-containing protein [Lewinellaceae bacterium]|nr:fibronectin type III domain-containing protein [Phaeodactylibacter sp.]MCB9035466.1 fibronectin type III domain-containing protein [Lewinellaceae bacterium]
MRNLKIVLFISCSLLLGVTACFFSNDNPLEVDSELGESPEIKEIQKDESANLKIIAARGYSDGANIVLERKSDGGFNPISFQKLDGSTFLDRSLDKERETTYFYRFKVEKDGFQSDYSNEKEFEYTSDFLNAPTNFRATIIENEGILLEWQDNSNNEAKYFLRKFQNDPIGDEDIEPNEVSFKDIIPFPENSPVNRSYRLQARSADRASDWAVIDNIVYTGFAPPTNLRVTDTSYNQFTIEWADNSGIEENYAVERKKDEGDFQKIATRPKNTAMFVDEITESGLYTYRVQATNNDLHSLYSNEVSHQFYDLLPRLIVCYPFNGNAKNECGDEYHGEVFGATLTADRKNQANSAYYFNGNSYINLGGNSEIVSVPFALSVWIKPTQWLNTGDPDFNWSAIINKFGLFGFETQGWYLGIHPIKQISITLDKDAVRGGNITLGQWTHIVANFNGSKLELYQDGELVASKQSSTTITTNLFCAAIGDGSCCLPSSSSCQDNLFPEHENFIGAIDDIKIFQRALTPEEVEALYLE